MGDKKVSKAIKKRLPDPLGRNEYVKVHCSKPWKDRVKLVAKNEGRTISNLIEHAVGLYTSTRPKR